jgi:hypothetical protein
MVTVNSSRICDAVHAPPGAAAAEPISLGTRVDDVALRGRTLALA